MYFHWQKCGKQYHKHLNIIKILENALWLHFPIKFQIVLEMRYSHGICTAIQLNLNFIWTKCFQGLLSVHIWYCKDITYSDRSPLITANIHVNVTVSFYVLRRKKVSDRNCCLSSVTQDKVQIPFDMAQSTSEMEVHICNARTLLTVIAHR